MESQFHMLINRSELNRRSFLIKNQVLGEVEAKIIEVAKKWFAKKLGFIYW